MISASRYAGGGDDLGTIRCSMGVRYDRRVLKARRQVVALSSPPGSSCLSYVGPLKGHAGPVHVAPHLNRIGSAVGRLPASFDPPAEVQVVRIEVAIGFQAIHVGNDEPALAQNDQSFVAQMLQRPVDVDGREAQHLRVFLLGEGERVAVRIAHARHPEADEHLAEQMRDPLRCLAQGHVH